MAKPIALLSVYDKNGIVAFAEGLAALGYELVSTGGTLRTLEEAGQAARRVSDLTGLPEILGGRVKTLHPAIFGGILARRNEASDMDVLGELGVAPIGVVAVNLSPVVMNGGAPAASETFGPVAGIACDEALARVDIGGPALLRAAARNHRDVYVVADPADYPVVLDALRSGRQADYLPLRRHLAVKALEATAAYDRQVVACLGGEIERDRDRDGTTAQPVPRPKAAPAE